MKYILYNPKANSGKMPDYLTSVDYINVIGLDYQAFFDKLSREDEVTLVGGDGTINYFINEIDTNKLKNNIYLEAAGTGNDFVKDVAYKTKGKILLNSYIKNLPTILVNGMRKKFINGIGFGIDGYCCEAIENMRKTNPEKSINYTSIALKGVLIDYKPRNAIVTVDGKTYSFENVWLASTMKGKFFGGGMKIAPNQDRKEEGLSVVICIAKSKFKMLSKFSTVFNGNHVKYTDMIQIIKGKEIDVKFDKPCALQIDGNSILDVQSYKVLA